ncbi:MAG TPA: hypothetical protein VME17_02765, partial [Bryobacteraceae bacterium]|nr:hypothetical protein [Bryobacteraceae bacterium]
MTRAQLVERGGKIAGNDGSPTESARQGSSIALSADGTTFIEGGPYDDRGRGAVWVFTRSGSARAQQGEKWAQQGEKLVANDAVGEGVFVGRSVALSADGNTALIGGDGDSEGLGAAWVFTRTNGVWTEQAKLIGDGATGKSAQGSSVALSADGNTAVIGGMSDNGGDGAAWIFVHANGAWRQQGAKLVGRGAVGGASQGHVVAVSADGNTALVGGSTDAHNLGAAWIFTRSGETWIQQGDKLVVNGAARDAVFAGYGAALSGDGNIAVIGGYGDGRNAGAAWVFARSGTVWAQQGEKLTAMDAAGAQFGYSIAISADGKRFLAGGPGDDSQAGAAWEFQRVNGVWIEVGRLVGSGASGQAQQGYAVAMSADGHIAAIGGILDRAAGGAVWTFGDPVLNITTPESAASGDPVNFIVTAQDGAGRTLPDYVGTIHFSSSDAQAELPIDAQLTGGAGTFALTFKTPGKQTITAVDSRASAIAATSGPVAVGAGLAVLSGKERTPIAHSTPQPTDYVSTVLATNPVAYFRLQAANDTDIVGGYTSTFQPGTTLSTSGPPICEPGNNSAALNGTTGWVSTSLTGPAGITGSASIAAWVNLAELPSQTAAESFYVAGFGTQYLNLFFDAADEN